jgi:hypothetical protein
MTSGDQPARRHSSSWEAGRASRTTAGRNGKATAKAMRRQPSKRLAGVPDASSTKGKERAKCPRPKLMLPGSRTACACLAARSSCESASLLEYWRAESSAQFPPYGVDVRHFLCGPLATHHSPLATAFPWPPAVWRLIYGTGIRNHAKPLKT